MFKSLPIHRKLGSITNWIGKPLAIPIILLVIAIASYGLLISRLGFYWDDFPLNYIKNVYGNAGLERYFSTNRPYWGYLYQVTFSVFSQPWQWQVNALFWRWISAVLVWLIIREIWPDEKKIALWISLLFLVYPGFWQQHISVIYSNLFIVLVFFFSSLYLFLIASKKIASRKGARGALIWHAIAIILSFYNLLALEYFFVLDLLRPLILWFALGRGNHDRRNRVRLTLVNWLPYLALWIGITIWRVFFFKYQTQNYQMSFIQSMDNSPLQAIFNLIKNVVSSFWVVLVNAWAQIFKIPNVAQLGLRTSIVAFFIVLAVTLILIYFLMMTQDNYIDRQVSKSIILTGLIACLLGGAPWWLIELPPTLIFPNDRFTLPFIFGACLVISGLFSLLSLRNWMKAIFIGILVGFAVGNQFQVTNQFRRDWETQRRFFWQLAWRIPELASGTTLMVNDLPVTFFSDNSLTAPLNWFWSPENNTQRMAYLLYYPSQRLGKSLSSLNPGTSITVDYLAAKFEGTTSKVVSIYYEPPACLRVLDKALDSDNRMLPMSMQAAAALSSSEWITPSNTSARDILPNNLYSHEPNHGWCYFFELADLARQQEKWEEVASIGNQAYQLNDYPNDPAEHFVYIEGYAHNGDWRRAKELTEQSASVLKSIHPLLCRLWQRIDRSTTDSQEKVTITKDVYSYLSCSL